MPTTIQDISEFIQMVVTAYSDPLLYMLVAMITFSILYHIKDLILSGLR